MPKHGKKFAGRRQEDRSRQRVRRQDAIALLKEIAYANFDETVEVHARLGIDPRQADQSVRINRDPPARNRQSAFACLSLPPARRERIALEAGADYAG